MTNCSSNTRIKNSASAKLLIFVSTRVSILFKIGGHFGQSLQILYHQLSEYCYSNQKIIQRYFIKNFGQQQDGF